MDHHHSHHHADSARDDDWSAMADLLDLDGEVLHEYLAEAIAWVHQLAAGRPVRRILDIGSG
ncbi:MAG TPA: SAM-dependent methyltransferase, partial [Streptosporangiaceae bacterium]|nr:SAM-dependent methyltransferase [Streptosporangiaceae bacterium]